MPIRILGSRRKARAYGSFGDAVAHANEFSNEFTHTHENDAYHEDHRKKRTYSLDQQPLEFASFPDDKAFGFPEQSHGLNATSTSQTIDETLDSPPCSPQVYEYEHEREHCREHASYHNHNRHDHSRAAISARVGSGSGSDLSMSRAKAADTPLTSCTSSSSPSQSPSPTPDSSKSITDYSNGNNNVNNNMNSNSSVSSKKRFKFMKKLRRKSKKDEALNNDNESLSTYKTTSSKNKSRAGSRSRTRSRNIVDMDSGMSLLNDRLEDSHDLDICVNTRTPAGNHNQMHMDNNVVVDNDGFAVSHDAEESIFSGNHVGTWETDAEMNGCEPGLQVDLGHPLASSPKNNANNPSIIESRTDVHTKNQDQDFIDAFNTSSFDFPTTLNTDNFATAATTAMDDGGFLSFEVADDWNPASNNFVSFDVAAEDGMGINMDMNMNGSSSNSTGFRDGSGPIVCGNSGGSGFSPLVARSGKHMFEDPYNDANDYDFHNDTASTPVYGKDVDGEEEENDMPSVRTAPPPPPRKHGYKRGKGRYFDDDNDNVNGSDQVGLGPVDSDILQQWKLPIKRGGKGPIDSDTLRQWNPADPSAQVYNAAAVQTMPEDLLIKNQGQWVTPEFNTRKRINKGSHPSPSNLSPNSDDLGYGESGPIDVDTLRPWAPTRNLMWKSETDGGDESSVTDDEIFKSNGKGKDKDSKPREDEYCQSDGTEEFTETEDHAPMHEPIIAPVFPSASNPAPSNSSAFVTPPPPRSTVSSATRSLNLELLAQISGLVNYDEKNADQYGKTYADDDSTVGEDAMEKASRKVIEPHEKSSPEEKDHCASISFHDGGLVLDPNVVSENAEEEHPFEADISKIENTSIDRPTSTVVEKGTPDAGAQKTPVILSSPFHANISKIHNHSQSQHVLEEPTLEEEGSSMELADPKALANIFHRAACNDIDTVQAEEEMEILVSQVKEKVTMKGTCGDKVEEPVKEEEKDDCENMQNVGNLKDYWKSRQHDLHPIKTDPVSTRKERLVSVQWPDAPISSPFEGKEQSIFGDDFFSRHKKKEPRCDIPTSVITSLQQTSSFATEMSSLCEESFDLTNDGFQVPKKKSAKELYRAGLNRTADSANSAKGFFWRSHPEATQSISSIENKTRKSSSSSKHKVKKETKKAVNADVRKYRHSSGANSQAVPSEYINFPKSSKSIASQKDETKLKSDSDLTKTEPNPIKRIQSSPKLQSNSSVPWDKDNLKLRKIQVSRSKSTGRPHTANNENGRSSQTMEWRRAIEAKIKITSDKVKAARQSVSTNRATSTETRSSQPPPPPPPQPTSRKQTPPFQANRNSFINRRQGVVSDSVNNTAKETIIHAGIPRTIEKRPLDEDAISGCSSSIADRIKAFESKAANDNAKPQPGMFSRSAPLNSYALSKLRNVTSNVGGLWS